MYRPLNLPWEQGREGRDTAVVFTVAGLGSSPGQRVQLVLWARGVPRHGLAPRSILQSLLTSPLPTSPSCCRSSRS